MIGKEVLNYRIVSLIGQGGMGSVFLAEHKHIKQQKVAIKVINKDMVNDFTRQKLKEEAEHLASLHHQNIVRFIDYHIDEEGSIYLVMEYAEGVSLERYIKEVSGLIVESRICPLFEPILDAVDYAHKQGILHRDIKPANVVIDKEGNPKILDFGISTIIRGEAEQEDNMIMGTPSYMSPEQVKGEKLDARSDIYALGVMLHQMLTGHAPYDTTTMSEHEINQRVVNEPLPRLQTFYKYISDKMQKVVDKATAKKKEDRYQSCAEFKKALHNAVYPPKVSKSIWAAAAMAALVAVGSGIWWWDYNRLKVVYYKDYAEQWGVPQGIGKLSSDEVKHRSESYRFEFQKRKLRRMSYVNSKDKLIKHYDSEQMERSSDMLLFYGDNGQLAYVKILDCSGRVLYKKTYDDKLNTVIFQYDDKNSTEFVLNANVTGYFSNPFLSSGNNAKSRISRYLLTYDDNGYVTKQIYAGVYNVKISDTDGISARAFSYDEKGRIIEERYLGFDGKPKATKKGLGIKRHTYNENDEWIETRYLTIDGKPSNDMGGVPVVKIERDRYGNRIKESYVNTQGELVIRTDLKAAGCLYTYDDNGNRLTVTNFGLDGKPCYCSEGYATLEYGYDNNGYNNKMAFFDVKGKPCLNVQGYSKSEAVNDENGNNTETRFYGLDGKLTLNTEGYARIVREYNDQGIETGETVYGTDDKPVLRKDGTAGYRIEVNDKGLVTSLLCLDTEMKPVKCVEGYYSYTQEFDVRGNRVKITFCKADEKTPEMQILGYAGFKQKYDDYGNVIEQTFFNEKGEACENNDGIYRWYAEYNEKGDQTKTRNYNLSGDLVLVNGIAGDNNTYDKHGNLLENIPVGTNNALAKNKLISRYKYDERDNQTELALFDIHNKPANNSQNFHKQVTVYNSRNQLIEARYYGTKNQLVTYSNDNYAIERNKYDERGNLIHQSFFDTKEEPVLCQSGWASTIIEYDGLNRMVRQLFFDVNGKPSDPKTMVPEGICTYDKWGNINYIASADGHGNLINNPQTGWCIKRDTYDLRGNIVEESYFDNQDQPTNSREAGCHKITLKYNDAGDRTEIAYFNADGTPSNGLYNYHREVDTYNEKHQLLSAAVYDAKGKPVNSSAGFHRMEQTYNAEGENTTRKMYSASGALIGSQRWNGSEWVNINTSSTTSSDYSSSASGQSDWKQTVAQMNSELPFDLGEDGGGLIVQSFKITGKQSCELTFKLPKSKYEYSDSEISKYTTAVSLFTERMKSENLPTGISIRSVLYDSKGRIVYTISR